MNLNKSEEKMQNDGFNSEQIKNIKDIIHFVGIAENLAWREKEGVLREDIVIKKTILKYLLNNKFIDDTYSKYQKYPVYKLNEECSELFNETDLQFQDKNFDSFLLEFNEINLNILCLISEYSLENTSIERFDISSWDSEDEIDYTYLLKNSIKGDLIYKEYSKAMFEFMNLIQKYNYYYEITPFQSNRREHKRFKFINSFRIKKILIDNVQKFKTLYGHEIKKLNKKKYFLNSIQMPENTLDLKIFMYDSDDSKEFYEISDELSKDNLITPIQFDEIPYFRIIEPAKYIARIREIKQKIIDDISTPIIEFLLNSSSNLLKTKDYQVIKKEKKTQPKDSFKKELVFISYSTKDADIFNVKMISERLTEFKEIEDVLYWQEDMQDNIIKYMNDNLGKCDVVLLFCSPNALTSTAVEKEWTAADAMNKPIIPVFIKTEHIPPFLRSRYGIEFDTFDQEKNIEEFYRLILKKTQKSK
jgi:hypothetical protein